MVDVTTISPQTRVAGRIEGSQDVRVEGQVEGTVVLTALLHIAPTGLVSGDVTVREARIDGSFVGDLRAQDRVVLSATAKVRGTLVSPLLEMADGAQLAGELTIGDVEGPAVTRSAEVATARPVTSAVRPAATTARYAPAASPVTRTPVPTRATAPAPPANAAPRLEEHRAPVTTVVVEEIEEVEEVEEVVVVEQVLASPAQDEQTSLPISSEPARVEEIIHELDEDYTVKELREELRRRDLAVSGTKAELIERLLQAEAAEQKR
jgi:cytoskeletal protein CcmA (bactofilin family)